MKGKRNLIAQPRWRLTLAVASVMFVTKAIPILAHAELIMAEPFPGAKLYQPPRQVELTFGEPVSPSSSIVVFGNNFQMINGVEMFYDAERPDKLAATIPPLSPGQYTVQWQAISVDRDVISGSYAFSVTGSMLDVISWEKLIPSVTTIAFGLLLFFGASKRLKKSSEPLKR